MSHTRQEIETALDAGKLRVRMSNGNLWTCRRNGATKTWKTQPDDFSIPIKYGFNSYGRIEPLSLNSEKLVILD